jgi:hypothetical protein
VLPRGWEINHYSDLAESEYLIADFAAARALGLRSIGGNSGTQVLCRLDDFVGNLPVGARVTLQITYQYEGAGRPGMAIQYHASPYRRMIESALEPTNGAWRTAEIAFTRPDTGTYVLLLHTGSTIGGTLWVKSVSGQVTEAPPE